MPQGQEAVLATGFHLLVGLGWGGWGLTFLPSPRIKSSDTHPTVSEGELFQDPDTKSMDAQVSYEMVSRVSPLYPGMWDPQPEASLRSTADASGDVGMCDNGGLTVLLSCFCADQPLWC